MNLCNITEGMLGESVYSYIDSIVPIQCYIFGLRIQKCIAEIDTKEFCTHFVHAKAIRENVSGPLPQDRIHRKFSYLGREQ